MAQSFSVEIVPNPCDESALLSIHNLELKNHLLEIMDLQGRVLRRELINGEYIELNKGQLTSGIYLVNLKSSHGQVLATKRWVLK